MAFRISISIDFSMHSNLKQVDFSSSCRLLKHLNLLAMVLSLVFNVVNNPCNDDLPFSHGTSPVQARCNLDSNGGGWIVLLRRTPEASEQTSFSRKWKDYENGFGNLTGEFWYGLKNMHCLTSRESMEVEVEMSKTDGTRAFLSYGNFRIDGPSTSYTLHVSDKQHEGADELGHHNGMKFTTTDRDNDNRHNANCAESFNGGGWWFNSCYLIHLTDSVNPMQTGEYRNSV